MLLQMAAAVEIDAGGFRWFGEAERTGPDLEAVTAAVRERLYADCYTRGRPAPRARWDVPPGPPRSPVAAAIAAGRPATRSAQHGWMTAGPGEVVREGLRLSVADADLPADGTVLMPAALPGLVPGHHLVLGATDLDGSGGGAVMRAYLHATPRGVAAVVAAVAEPMDAAGIPFRVKTPATPDGFRRCDAVVLYARMDDAPEVTRILRRRYPGIAALLRPAVPALTLRLAPGVGWAVDPGNLDSFGHDRCGHVAAGFVRAGPGASPRRMARAAEAALHEAGIDPRRPHLGPGGDWAPQAFA